MVALIAMLVALSNSMYCMIFGYKRTMGIYLVSSMAPNRPCGAAARL